MRKKQNYSIILFEKIATIVISIVLVSIGFVAMMFSGTQYISIYQGISIVLFIVVIIILLMI
ncbi:MAG: hypothetical protein J7L45_01270 [Candidatus Aenigmarchaeota archaeon]|nr:hypothetical protein [Candidatus Aenigmarchaeota archaeon]